MEMTMKEVCWWVFRAPVGYEYPLTRDNARALAAGYLRYEYLRTLNVSQFKALFEKCLAGARFDDEVDAALCAVHRERSSEP